MKFRSLILFAAAVCFAPAAFGQDLPAGTEPNAAYTLGPGDEVTVKVIGEDQYDFIAKLDERGMIEVLNEPVNAKCLTESDLRAEVVKKLSRYLRDPKINLRVTDRKSRPAVSVYGEVNEPQRVTLERRATLLELLAFSGGIKEKASGTVQVFRTRPVPCSTSAATAWKTLDENSLIPSRTYSLSSIKRATGESNPEIFPGDIIVVGKAPPVYVIGEVMSLKEINMSENGLSLTEAVAQAGGFGPRAKTKDIHIRRLKANSREREIINVNFQLIKEGKQKDIMLEPEDIIEVDKAPKSVLETVLELVSGTARGFTNVLPQRVMF